LSCFNPRAQAGSSSLTVLTNFSIETGFARNLSRLPRACSLVGRTGGHEDHCEPRTAIPHGPHDLAAPQVFLLSVDACDYDLRCVWFARGNSGFIITYDFCLDTFFGEGIGNRLSSNLVLGSTRPWLDTAIIKMQP
jgi:hypothetical protein